MELEVITEGASLAIEERIEKDYKDYRKELTSEVVQHFRLER